MFGYKASLSLVYSHPIALESMAEADRKGLS